MTESSEDGSRKAELRAVWKRLSEHTDGLRRVSDELTGVSEGGSAASPDLSERLASHATGVREAVSDFESIAAAAIGEREIPCSA
jgi:hypothetical protein